MRTIKYRVCNKVWGMMIDKEIYNLGIDETGIHRVDWINTTTDGQQHKEIWENPDDLIVMQYTGLKDKNGKEIYEGDLIRFTEVDEDSCFGREDTEVVEVKWIEEIAQYRAVFKSGRRTELHFVVQLPTVVSCEIIGNIYKNPELLN